ncbi:MAG: FKBP-type peptidyl-prolyl cis-trans isomerase [Patescibacteria group bacterium]|nr:FKBP-type peptidyl-prolyl cis-trans isomerase [Patescibacteria group bacterium]
MFRNKKWIIISVLAVVIIVIVALVVWLIYDKNETNNQSAITSGGTIQLNQNKSANDTISLEPKASEQNNPNTLSVTDSASSSTNLGSGNRPQTNNSPTSKKEDFSQYEQYKDKNEIFFGEIAVGNGPEAAKDKQLAVTYTGYLTNGQVFDQSRPANNGQLQPLLFTLGAGQLIPGFELGVNGMKVGGTRRVIIPPSLGYGDKVQGQIPANSVLIFDISLTAAQ